MVAQRLGMKEEGLRKALWAEDGGDCYFNPKTKAVWTLHQNAETLGPRTRNREPTFPLATTTSHCAADIDAGLVVGGRRD